MNFYYPFIELSWQRAGSCTVSSWKGEWVKWTDVQLLTVRLRWRKQTLSGQGKMREPVGRSDHAVGGPGMLLRVYGYPLYLVWLKVGTFPKRIRHSLRAINACTEVIAEIARDLETLFRKNMYCRRYGRDNQ